VYLLWNPRTYRTYIGASTDPHRRLRQHRREIKGGAKATFKEAGSWLPVLYLYGFKDRSEAYRWEKLLKLRASGLQDRREAFCQVAIGICPKHPKKVYSKEYPVPSGIVLKFYDKDADKQV
jgi:predicted GIY-YIG superfamily endonuclease